ncbi:MAG: glycosyltransferase, partial [Gaiellaceae bacterium]
ADVVAVPSRREGMSLAMLEAMASGRSVVSTAVPGADEALRSDAGAVVPLGRRDLLASALGERLLDPGRAEREGTVGRSRAERVHDARQTAQAIADIYAELGVRLP